MLKQKTTLCSYRWSKDFICRGFLCFSFGILLLFGIRLSLSIDVHAAEEASESISSTQVKPENEKSERKTVRPKIAIVIDDLGANQALTERAIALPTSISLAFLPTSKAGSSLVARAIEVGHEVLIHMPMEPLDPAIEPGPGALNLAMSLNEVLNQLGIAFTQIPGAVGLNNHMGSRYTQDEAAMAILMGELKARNMFFLDSRTTPHTKAESIAIKRKVKTVSRDIFLDNNRSKTAIRDQFFLLEKLAAQKGTAVAIGHPYEETFSVLEDWIPDAVMRGYTLVQISTAVK